MIATQTFALKRDAAHAMAVCYQKMKDVISGILAHLYRNSQRRNQLQRWPTLLGLGNPLWALLRGGGNKDSRVVGIVRDDYLSRIHTDQRQLCEFYVVAGTSGAGIEPRKVPIRLPTISKPSHVTSGV